MRFRDDTRGVTVQVGAVLLFATIIIALSLYQATVVPSQNADVEYKHSQAVEGQLADVRNALLSTAATGNSRPASVALGTQYPSRVFLMNPPPPAGTLRTGSYENNTISVANVRAANEETAQFIDGNWSAPTKYLAYEPDYHEYDNAPDLIYESSILSNYYPDTDGGTGVPLTDQMLVRGDTITLVAVNGSLNTAQSGSVSVDPEALSAPYRRVQVTNDSSGPVTVTLPTRVSAGTLANTTDLLAEDAVKTVEPAGDGRVRVVLYNGTYTLRTASVGVGSTTTDPGPQYLTVVERDDDSVTVEARDRFNNPESGVNVSVNGTNPFEERSQLTGEDGQVTFEADDSGTATLEILGGNHSRERVTTTVSTASGDGTGAGGNGSEAYLVDWIEEQSGSQNPGLTCDGENCTLDASVQSSVTLFADSTPVVDGGTFVYGVSDSSVVTVSPGSNETDSDGETTTELTAQRSGNANVYVSGGGSGDTLSIDVVNAVSPNLPPSVEITSIERAEQTGSGKVKSVDVTFTPDDSDGNLDSADVVVYTGGSQSGSETVDLTGEEGTSQTVRVPTDNSAGEIEAEVIVYDTDGEQGSDRKSENDV